MLTMIGLVLVGVFGALALLGGGLMLLAYGVGEESSCFEATPLQPVLSASAQDPVEHTVRATL